MASTNYSNGTVVGATWLNEVDAEVFGSQSAQYATLQAFLTANAGKFCRIRGSHTLSAGVTVPAGTFVDATGAELTWSAQVTGVTFTNGGGWVGGTLTGPGNASYNASGIAMYCSGTNNAPSAPTYVDAPVIFNVKITEWGNYGVHFVYTNNGRVLTSKITECGYGGVTGLSCTDMHVDGNYIGQIGPGTSSNAYGCFIDRSEGTLTADPTSKRCHITNNTVEDVTIWEALDTHAGEDFVITGNIIKGCKTGIAVTDSDVSNTPTYGPKRVIVADNTIYADDDGAAIIVTGAFTGGSHVDYAEDIIVANNMIYKGGLANDAAEGCIRARGTKGLVVEGNTLNSPVVAGLNLYFDNYDFVVNGNVFRDPWDNTYASPACIIIGGNNNKGLIDGNIFAYTGASPGTNVAVRSIDITSGRTGLDIELGRNMFRGIDATHLTYNEGTSTGVNAAGLQVQRGTGQLTAGAQTITFDKRFAFTPKVYVTTNNDLNPIRVSAVSTTQATFTGTGTTTYTWIATT